MFYSFLILVNKHYDVFTIVKTLGNYPGDSRLYSGDRVKRSKFWRLPDYPGGLAAMPYCAAFGASYAANYAANYIFISIYDYFD